MSSEANDQELTEALEVIEKELEKEHSSCCDADWTHFWSPDDAPVNSAFRSISWIYVTVPALIRLVHLIQPTIARYEQTAAGHRLFRWL